jgi:YD repeat-containing protein
LRNGLIASVTDPSGAKQEWTYDDLDRQITSTQIERQPALANLTTKTALDDGGNVMSVTSPTGVTSANTYDALGQLLKATDSNGVVADFGYDSAGRPVVLSDGLGRMVRSIVTASRTGMARLPDGTSLKATAPTKALRTTRLAICRGSSREVRLQVRPESATEACPAPVKLGEQGTVRLDVD